MLSDCAYCLKLREGLLSDCGLLNAVVSNPMQSFEFDLLSLKAHDIVSYYLPVNRNVR